MQYSTYKVKFVKHKGEVIALFPEQTNSCYDNRIGCYAKIGQHSEADKSLLRCKKATPEEFYPLLQELRSIYENSKLGEQVLILKILN